MEGEVPNNTKILYTHTHTHVINNKKCLCDPLDTTCIINIKYLIEIHIVC